MATPPTAASRATAARTQEANARASDDPVWDALSAEPDVQPSTKPVDAAVDPAWEALSAEPDPIQHEPSTIPQQVASGIANPIPNRSRQDVTGIMGDLWDEVYAAEKRAGRPENAAEEAWRVVDASRHQVASGDKTHLWEPAHAVARVAVDATTPGSIPNQIATAYSPRWMYDTNTGPGSTAGWRVAEGDVERRMAAKQRAARDMAYGISATNAKATAEELLNTGAPLLLATTENRGTTTVQTDVAREKIELPVGLQSVQDIGIGTERAMVSAVNTAKDIMDTVPYATELAFRAVGADSAAATAKAVRDWTIPDPLEALAQWVEDSPRVNAIPGTDAILNGYADTMRRQGSVVSGTIGAINAVSPWDIDPEADGLLNTLTRVAVATPRLPEWFGPVGAEDVFGQTIAAGKTAVKSVGTAAQTNYDVLTGDATLGEAGSNMARAGADVLGVAKPTLMTGMQALSYDPQRRETTLGWWMRVGGSALQGFTSTYLAEVADKTLTQMGATSFRKHRRPGDVKVGGVVTAALGPNASAGALNAADWIETLIPLLDPADFAADYATTVYNGDSFTSETMRVLDTLALGTDWFSPETQRSLLPGGTLNEWIVDAAMAGDLMLPVDHIPGRIIKEPYVRGARFYDGFKMGMATGPKLGDAAVQGAAWAFPGVTDRLLRGGAEYEAGLARGRGEVDRPAAPMPPGVKSAPRATDAPTVHSAVLYAHFRREVEAGRDPIERLRKSTALTDSALGRRASEVLTIVGATEQPRQVPLPTPAATPATPPPAATAMPTATVPPSAIAIAATPTRTPARTAILDAATDAHTVAKTERRGPLAAWPDSVNAEPDLARRQGLALSALGAHLGSTHPNAVLAAFQAAAAYTDGHGNFVTVPWPDADGLDQMSPRHIDLALDRLKNASPEQVWRHTVAMEHGERPVWVNEVSPARQAERDRLVAMARNKEIHVSVREVEDVYLPILDRMAEAVAREGVVPNVEAFWRNIAHEAREPDTTGSGIPAKPGKVVIGMNTRIGDGRSLITLGKNADLATLFHESAHALRAMLPPEKMATVDAHVQATFGGWAREAEEWYALQFESVLRTGEMVVPKAERAKNPGLFDRLTDAFRTAARVLVSIYKSGALPEVHPVFAGWMRDFMRLDGTEHVPDRVVARIPDENDLQVAGKLPADPEMGTVPVDRVEGLNPERVASLEAQLARIAEMADGEEAGKPRRRKIHGMLNTIVRWAPALAEEIKATRKAGVVVGGDIAYVRGLIDKATVKAEPAPPTAPTAVVGAPSDVVPAAPPAPPRKALEALAKRTDEMVAGSENASGGDTMRRAKNVVVSTMAAVMERAGEEGVATEAMARDRFGEAVVSDFLTGVREAYKTYKPGKDTTTDAARVAAVAKAADTFLRKTGAKQPEPVRIEPRLPAIMDDTPVPVAPIALPASAPPGIVDQPMGAAGGAWLDLRGKPRMMMDSTGALHNIVITRLRFEDVVPSHTQSLTAWRDGYPKELQNRLDAFSREGWIEGRIREFYAPAAMDPLQITPTMGAPTAWQDPATGRHYVTSGNGRYLVMERIREMAKAGDPRAQTLVAEMDHAVDMHSRALGLGNAQPGDILMPVLVDAPLHQAMLFARFSQESTSVEMAQIEKVLSGAEVIRRSDAPVVLDLDRLPPELTDSTVGAYVEVNRPAFDKALTVLFPDAAARETLFAQGGQNLLEAVQSVLLAQIDPETQAYAMRYGKEVVDRLVVAAPALVALDTLVGNHDDLAPFRVGDYYRDAVELWRGAVKDKSTDPAKFVQYARLMGGQGNLLGATPLPVSKVSFALAMVMMQKLTPGGVFKQLRDLEVELRDARKPRAFGGRPDHVKTVVEVLSGDTRIKDLVPAELPGTHAEAVELAQSIRERTLSDKLSRQPDPVTAPPGFDVVQESIGEPVTDQRVLFQHRDYREAATNASSPGASPVLETQAPLRDETPKVKMASALHDRPTNVYGAVVQTMRDKPLLDRRQMLLALGYRGDQKVFDAIDLQARALAWSATSLLQGGELPMRYSRIGARVAVPVGRIAGVRARTVGLLGDLPRAVLDGVVKIGEREVVRLSPADADRFLVIRDYLIASGWSDSLTLSAQRLTRGDLVHGVAGGGVADLTTDTWRAFVGAVTDSQSGAMPFRGRADRVNLATQLVWWAAQKRTDYDVLPRDAPLPQQLGYAVRSKVSAAIITAARFVLPGEMWAPDMPEHVRDIFDRYRRKMGRAPGDLAEALELAIWKARDDGASRDTEILEGIRALSTRLDGLDAPISIAKNGQGFSDLDELRGWLFADPVPGAVKVSAPYSRPPGGHVQHDLPRVSSTSAHPFNWQEVLQHRDLVERIIRRAEVLDATTVDALAELRAGTIDADTALFLHGKVWAALASAEAFGLDILTSAAGQSGDVGKMRQRIDASGKQGVALDAYEDFFFGRYDVRPGDNGQSVAARVVEIGAGQPVDTIGWVAETMNALRTKWLTERFFDELVDNQYALDLTELWRSANPDAPLPSLAERVLFSTEVRNAASAILLGTDHLTMTGTTASGEPVWGSGNMTGISQEARYAAHAMIAKMGLRPDIAATRSAMKGQVTPSPIQMTYRGANFDAQGVRLATPDTTAYDTINAWRPSEGATTLYGRDLFLSTPLAERIRELQSEQGPVGQLISNNLRDRTTGEKMVATFVDYWRQYKGSLVTGGPNGIAAIALAGVAFTGGATLPAAALAGATGLLLSYRPRLSGYATNFLGGYIQGYTEYGALGAARAALLGTKSSRAAIIATGHAIHLTRMKAPLSWASRVMAYAGGKMNGAIDHNGFIDPSGRVWTTMDIYRYGEANGLDGTQARFESAERASHAIDRMGRMYGPQTPMGRIYTAVASFFGRHALAENYRKLYEANDTYFKYAYFIRGIMDGMEPTESLNRSLAATFDYSATAPIDRMASGAILFWMYGRRTVDLSIRTLLTNPTRVLGPIRLLRAQNLTAPNADTNEDHVVVSETIPDYAQGRFAINYLPSPNPEQGGFKVSLQEALPVTAMRLLSDIGNLDLPALAGRGNPAIEMGFNAMSESTGGQRISFFRKKAVDSDVYWDVPMWFIKVDQEAFGGSFTREFGVYPEPTNDPSRWVSPGYPYVFRVPPENRAKWDMFRNVAGMGAIFGNADIDQKSGGYTRWLTNGVSDWIATLDPASRYGFRSPTQGITAQGGVIIPATQMQPPSAIGADVEGLRDYGAQIAPYANRVGTQAQLQRDAYNAAQARLADEKQQEWKSLPPGKVEGVKPAVPTRQIGIDPSKPLGNGR